MHLTESLDIPGSSVFVKRSKRRPEVRAMSYPKSSRPGLSQPRWIRVAPSVHPGSSFLPNVRLRSSAAKRGRQRRQPAHDFVVVCSSSPVRGRPATSRSRRCRAFANPTPPVAPPAAPTDHTSAHDDARIPPLDLRHIHVIGRHLDHRDPFHVPPTISDDSCPTQTREYPATGQAAAASGADSTLQQEQMFRRLGR